MNVKIITSSVVVLVLYCVLIWLTTKVKKAPEDVPINITLLILGAVLGWVLGIFLTPYDPEQKSDFNQYASYVALVVSGYLVGKFDAAISYIFKPENLFTPMVGFRVIMSISSLLLAMLITVVIRFYL